MELTPIQSAIIVGVSCVIGQIVGTLGAIVYLIRKGRI